MKKQMLSRLDDYSLKSRNYEKFHIISKEKFGNQRRFGKDLFMILIFINWKTWHRSVGLVILIFDLGQKVRFRLQGYLWLKKALFWLELPKLTKCHEIRRKFNFLVNFHKSIYFSWQNLHNLSISAHKNHLYFLWR